MNDIPLLTRRSTIGLLGGASTFALGGARPARAQPAPAIGKGATLTVSTWGGITSDGIRDYVGPEFEKLTGAKLAFDIGGQGARYNKLLAQKGNQSADVFFGTDESVVGGLRAGVLQPADQAAVPNFADVHDWAVTVKAPAAGQIAGVPYTLISYALAYNPGTVKTPPTSWADLWRPEFEGKLAFAAAGHSQMPALVILAAELAGGSATNVDPGFAKLAQLRPNKLTFFWTDWAPMLKTGDTAAATEFDYYLEAMKMQGYPVDYVFPTEGAIGSPELVAMVAGTKNREISQVFLNLMIDPTIQETFAAKSFQGPTNRKTRVSADVAAKISFGEERLKHVRFFDPVMSLDNRPAWTERMTTEVVPAWRAR
jgi:putative spermidine/putrescine transport system substrate-binding protein